MKSSGAEDQASKSVDSAGVTIKTNQSAESVPTDDPKGEADSAGIAICRIDEAGFLTGP
ncbi:hypothetical protein PF008_g28980 [Phytophthora fragariae]|uniref:Uncharacterized protein n=1 Tax=Phytophthora fragariae TaxID=53985 RepID=A0A6G0Q9U5_9STRA|nr:hypothetical protein PF008_g28980 [Phytophthora fragariae]